MKRPSRSVILGCILWLLFSWHQAFAVEERVPGPCLNKGKKWRIGYYEGGPWQHYRESLKVTVKGLMERGWIDEQPLPEVSLSDQPSTLYLWQSLSSSLKSQYIEFVSDAFWTSEWEESKRPAVREDCIHHLQDGYVDLIFAMGTRGGKDIANDRHSVPTMVMSTTDAVQSGIVKSAEDSGRDHVHARCDPTRHHRQIRLFHDIFQFKKIGAVYDENDPDSRVLAHLDKLEQIGKERGFNVIACSAADSIVSLQEAVAGFRRCVNRLAPQVDAFYLADMQGTEADFLWETLQPLIEYKVPTWSARGSMLVQRGALLSVARENFEYLAPFYSEVVARIFNGTKPRAIPQIIKEKLRLAINLETAKRIGYEIPPNILKVADIVYDRVEIPVADP